MKITWDNLDEIYSTITGPLLGNRTLYEQLCAESKGSDFYFHVSGPDEYNHSARIYVVPVVYFLKTHYAWDQSLHLDHLLPEDCLESMECVWETDLSVGEVMGFMAQRGFTENDEFSALVNDCFES